MAYKRKTKTDKFRPAGGKGLSIDIKWGSKFTPRLIRQWRPVAQLAAVWGFHIRERVRDHKRGPTGQRLGPGKLSGGMWKGLAVGIRSAHGGRGGLVYFAGSSPPYRKNSKGEIVRRRHRPEPGKKKGKFHKGVKNTFKALIVSGLGRQWTFTKSGGKWQKQTKAAGGGKPTMILTPSASEGQAVTSFVAMGIDKRGMQGNQRARKAPQRGDRRLLSKLKRSL